MFSLPWLTRHFNVPAEGAARSRLLAAVHRRLGSNGAAPRRQVRSQGYRQVPHRLRSRLHPQHGRQWQVSPVSIIFLSFELKTINAYYYFQRAFAYIDRHCPTKNYSVSISQFIHTNFTLSLRKKLLKLQLQLFYIPFLEAAWFWGLWDWKPGCATQAMPGLPISSSAYRTSGAQIWGMRMPLLQLILSPKSTISYLPRIALVFNPAFLVGGHKIQCT